MLLLKLYNVVNDATLVLILWPLQVKHCPKVINTILNVFSLYLHIFCQLGSVYTSIGILKSYFKSHFFNSRRPFQVYIWPWLHPCFCYSDWNMIKLCFSGLLCDKLFWSHMFYMLELAIIFVDFLVFYGMHSEYSLLQPIR